MDDLTFIVTNGPVIDNLGQYPLLSSGNNQILGETNSNNSKILGIMVTVIIILVFVFGYIYFKFIGIYKPRYVDKNRNILNFNQTYYGGQ